MKYNCVIHTYFDSKMCNKFRISNKLIRILFKQDDLIVISVLKRKIPFKMFILFMCCPRDSDRKQNTISSGVFHETHLFYPSKWRLLFNR